ncbi:MAG: DNA mismatch repair protein MutT [Chlorobiota bacterium]
MSSSATEQSKESIAVLIRSALHPDKVLLVLRPEDDPELPGIWGLPAVSLRPGESDDEALKRLAKTKLGCELADIRFRCAGSQQRPNYRLSMRLYEASLHTNPQLPTTSTEPVTLYRAWRWGRMGELSEGAQRGSLCSQLALQSYAADAA